MRSRYKFYSMDGLSSSLAVLTAMITPAVLISASGTMILSSSTRLGRVVDRTRSLSDRLQEVSSGDANTEFFEERRAMLYDQLDKLTSRSRLLQRALWMGPGGDGTHRRVFSLLWQHAFGVRSAAGAEHHARRNGFHLADDQTLRAQGTGRATQDALRAL